MLLQESACSDVWIIPTHEHPFGKPLALFGDRLSMCRLAFSRFGSRVEVLDLERLLGGVSYTIRTLEALKRNRPHVDLKLVIGSDVLEERKQWKDWHRIETMVECVIVPREGYACVDPRCLEVPPVPAVSSTEIRRRVRDGLGPEGLLNPMVVRYIHEHALYRRGDESSVASPEER